MVENSFVPHRLDDIERRHILQTLAHFDGNKEAASRALGITSKTLYNKLHTWGIADEWSASEIKRRRDVLEETAQSESVLLSSEASDGARPGAGC